MAKEERFIRIYNQGGMITTNEIWVDTVTGVNYLFHACGNAAGFTPLLGADGKPVITPPNEPDEKWPNKW